MTPVPPQPGPLVQPQGSTGRPGPWKVTFRVFLGLGVAAYCAVYLPLVGLYFAVSSALGVPWGWVIGVAVMAAPVVVIAGGLLLSGVRAWMTVSFAAIAGTLAVVVALALAAASVPQPRLLQSELDEVGVPSGWIQTGEVTKKGGCLDYCSSVKRTYEVQGTPAEALEQLVERFDDRGYDLSPLVFDEPTLNQVANSASTDGRGPIGDLDLEAGSADSFTEVRIELEGK